MATKKELLARAEKAGVEVAKSWTKAKIEKALANAGAAPSEASEASGPIGLPTEPEKAGLDADGMKALEASLDREAPGRQPKGVGIPTEPDRGGVTDLDVLIAKGKPPKATETKRPEGRKATLTGNPYAPTEPERGGVNKLEKELTGT